MTFEAIQIAWRSLTANRLRSALAAAGIGIGIFSVVSVMTAISALERTIETGLGFLGANTFQFAKYPGTVSISGDEQFQNRRNIDYETYLAFARLMGNHADLICPKVFDRNVQAVYQNRKTNPNLEICGTNEVFILANRFPIRAGRNLFPEDVAFSRSVCLIGSAVAERLFPAADALGKTIRIDRRSYLVIGTFTKKGATFGENPDNRVIIPITTFFQNYGSTNRTINIAVQARNQKAYERTMMYAVGAFRQARGLQPGDANNFEIYSNDSLLSEFRSIAKKVQLAALLLSAIALITAGVSIMNVMLVAVTERIREIGIRKSVGAKPYDIRFQFLVEALLLSLAGAVIGIVLGVAAGNLLAGFLKAELVFPLGWSIICVLICSGVGLASGVYPAQKAASLDPVEALRSE